MADKWEASREAGDFFQSQIRTHLPPGESLDRNVATYRSAGFLRRSKYRLSNALLDLAGIFAAAVTNEVETGTAFNSIPVFLGLGIAVYFIAPQEPHLLVLLLSFSLFAVIAWRIKWHGKTYFVLAALTAIFAGISAAKIATVQVSAPQIERQLTGRMTGLVLSVEQNRRGSPRYLVRVNELDDLPDHKLPVRLRVSAASTHERILPGDYIKGLVRVQPVSGPAYPGGYDFSFFAWFNKLGGSGFFMGAPRKLAQRMQANLGDHGLILINRARLAIEGRITKVLPGETGDIAIALITGNRTRISNETQQSLRKSGLAHILAISGLHMALVTLTVVWLVRGLCTFYPRIVMHYPVKKWAICSGFLAATLYLGLSGAGIATQRAWIMISVMLLAVVMDRRAITMRSVSISAILILLINPQSLLSPGFQMSFAAVGSLVAGYEALNKRRWVQPGRNTEVGKRHWVFASFGGLTKYFGGIALTSLIAGAATGLFAAWHFHQVATLGLLGNLLAMPIVALLVMPLALFSMLLMPYGFESLTLQPMSWAIEQVIDISIWVEGISPLGEVGLQPIGFLLIGVSGLTILTLLKSRLRLAGLGILLLLPFISGNPVAPDILVSENGRAIGVKTDTGELGLLYPRSNRFISDIWLKAWSGNRQTGNNLDVSVCDRERCIITLPNGQILHVVYDPDLLKQSCISADILIAPRLWWVNCYNEKPELVLKRRDFEQYGTHALYIETNARNQTEIRIATALGKPTRPWQRQVNPKKSFSDTAGSIQPVSPEPSPGQN